MDFLGSLDDDVHEPHMNQNITNKCSSNDIDQLSPAPVAGFDCNICLDSATEPVVTLCGHLYCWPCLYKWMDLNNTIQSRRCPVCKAAMSSNTIVPLYGRGQNQPSEGSLDIPKRPSTNTDHSPQSTVSVPIRRQQYDYQFGCRMGGIAVLLLSWTFRNLSPYQIISGSNERIRRHELQMERLLHQMWVFLLCCALCCLLLF